MKEKLSEIIFLAKISLNLLELNVSMNKVTRVGCIFRLFYISSVTKLVRTEARYVQHLTKSGHAECTRTVYSVESWLQCLEHRF